MTYEDELEQIKKLRRHKRFKKTIAVARIITAFLVIAGIIIIICVCTCYKKP